MCVCVCVRACAHVRVEERGQCLFDFWAVWPQQQATHIHTHELYVLNFLSLTDGTGLSFTLMYILAAFPKTVMQHFRLIEIQHVKVNQLIQLSTQLFKRAFTYLDVRFHRKSNDYYYFFKLLLSLCSLLLHNLPSQIASPWFIFLILQFLFLTTPPTLTFIFECCVYGNLMRCIVLPSGGKKSCSTLRFWLNSANYVTVIQIWTECKYVRSLVWV